MCFPSYAICLTPGASWSRAARFGETIRLSLVSENPKLQVEYPHGQFSFQGDQVMSSLKQIRFTLIFALALALPGTLTAQDNANIIAQKSSVTITAAASADRVRITAPASVVQMHLEVYGVSGEKLFDNEIRGGNVVDWNLQDGQVQRLSSGDYVCVVTVKNIAGRITQKIGSVKVAEKDVRVDQAELAQLSPQQSQVIGPVEENSSWTILNSKENQTTTVIAHDGTDGQIVRGRGAFSFRIGDFFSGNDQEQMRLTEEGNLGIGTSKPKAKLDVAGAVRARQGFVFNDGSTLKVNDKGLLTLTDSNGNVVPDVSGSGTTGRLTKWTDGASGTLGDSVALDTGTGLQLTAAPSGAVDTNLLYLNSTNGTTGVLAGSTPSYGAANGSFFAMRGNTYTTIPNHRGLFKIAAGNVSSPVGDDGSVKFNTGDDQLRMVIRPNGRVGIGTPAPAQKLHIVSGTADFQFGAPSGADGIEIQSNLAGHAPAIWLTHTGTGGRKYRIASFGDNTNPGSFVIRDETSGTDRLTIDQSGKVQIFFSSVGTLTFKTADFFLAGLSTEASNRLINFGINTGREGPFQPLGPGFFLTADLRPGTAGFHFVEKAETSGAESDLMTVTSAGNVGIGTNGPGSRLHVNVPSSTNPISAMTIDVQSFSTPGNAVASHFFRVRDIGSGSPPAFLIRGDGSVGIGTDSPGAKLEIAGNALIYPASGAGQLRIRNRTSSDYSQVLFLDDSNNYRGYIGYVGANYGDAARNDTVEFGTNSKDITFRPNEAEVIRLTTSGRVGIGTNMPDQVLSLGTGTASKPGGGSWAIFSDERLKNIKGHFTSGLKAVMQLQPIRYEYKPNNALDIKSEGEHIGFSAQAVQKIIPEAVIKNDKGYLLINNDPIIWTMLNAVKEQQAQIIEQQELIRKQQDALKQQQSQIELLKKLICSDHPGADVCQVP